MNAIAFVSGVAVTTFLASGLFFIRFWRASHDRFFIYFASACFLIALEKFVQLFIPALQQPLRTAGTDDANWVYLIRLLAFVVILVAVLDKNRRAPKP